MKWHDRRLDDFSFAIYFSLQKPGESQGKGTALWGVNVLSCLYKLPFIPFIYDLDLIMAGNDNCKISFWINAGPQGE